MLIAKVKGTTVTSVADYREMFPNTSFTSSGPDAAFMLANGCLPVSVSKQHNQRTEKLIATAPYIENGQVYTVKVGALSDAEIKAMVTAQWSQVALQRDALLSACDWTQLPDSPLTNKNEWATYRQKLRDITNQADPYNIVWPVAPN